MPYLVAVLAPAALLVAFLVLTRLEARRGTRLFAERRAALDSKVEVATAVFSQVDFLELAEAKARETGAALLHEAVRLSLLLVRGAERLLTRLVKYLRTRQAAAPAPSAEPTSAFVKTLSGFKEELRATTPPVVSI